MKIVLEHRTRHKIEKGNMKTVLEKRSRVVLSGVPGSVASDSFRLLEDGEMRLTENGDFRILE